MGWFRPAGQTIQFRGAITPSGFAEWANGEGLSVIDALVERRGFSLLGRRRAVLREVWKDIQGAAGTESVATALRQMGDDYLRLLGSLAADLTSLPRSGGLRPVAAVPRVLLSAAAFDLVTQRLGRAPGLRSLKGGESLKQYFLLQIVEELDGALLAAQASPSRPVPADGEWVVVGANDTSVWRIPFRGRPWNGHFFLYEAPRGQVRRRDRRDVTAQIAEAERLIAALSPLERDQILNRARR